MDIKALLDEWVEKVNQPNFIANDPIQIPHRFSKKQDIEIAGFFAAILAWGNRKSIINKCTDLLNRMDNAPFEFVTNANDEDLKRISGFVHRTFNDTDAWFLLNFLKKHYAEYDSLERAFSFGINPNDQTVQHGLEHFYNCVFGDQKIRTQKHIATPYKKSACKRLNMYLRWMVRKDNNGVDFGLWSAIKMNQLVCPLDVHVQKAASVLGLTHRKQADWQTALELTEVLKSFDAFDPVKYDFALFGMGVAGYLKN
ncbi:MAG: hypothetical protein ACI8ZN_002080 [Bacteroidia bacterium]|jgi:uncharacterized protein (TIGR02757 family)